jgi:hydroxymethylbilane synthase
MPLAAHGHWQGAALRLDAAWGDPEGSTPLVRAQGEAPVATLAEAEALGESTARQLRALGARV